VRDALGDIPKEIKIQLIRNCVKADPSYGKRMPDTLKISLYEV
jgi:hypothetical protein